MWRRRKESDDFRREYETAFILAAAGQDKYRGRVAAKGLSYDLYLDKQVSWQASVIPSDLPEGIALHDIRSGQWSEGVEGVLDTVPGMPKQSACLDDEAREVAGGEDPRSINWFPIQRILCTNS
jgi:hypothetical protein